VPPQMPAPLKSTDWLDAHLADEDLRVYDCTSFLIPDPVSTYRAESGHANWAQAHIPGAGYIALQNDLSDPASGLRFTMPSPTHIAETMAAFGVNDRSTVVLYSTSHYMWASRIWWMLKSIGFERAFVLDGGFAKWIREGRLVAKASRPYPRGNLAARPRDDLFVDRSAVLAAIGDPDTILVNALPAGQYRGDPDAPHQGRRGHIKSSVNLPAMSLLSAPGTLRERAEIEALLSDTGIGRNRKVICYCGGGVSATCVALALTVCEFDRVAVYDGSLNEWAADPRLPMELGLSPCSPKAFGTNV
jgi:thiosulfate/3-mercaptopyruvate sulfurtransferase